MPLARSFGLLQLDLEPFHLGAKLFDLTGLEPSQFDEFLVSGRFAFHDGFFTRTVGLNATGKGSAGR